MGLLDFLFPASTAAAGALSNRPQTTRGTSTTSFGKPTEDIVNQMLGKYTDLLSKGPGGFISAGMQNINRNAGLKTQALQNILAQRGISGDAAAFAEGNLESERFKDITDFQNQAPLDFLSKITSGISQLPLSKTTTSEETTPGNILGGATTGLAAALAQIYGQGGGGGGMGGGNNALGFPSIMNGLHFLTGLGKGTAGSWSVPGTDVGGPLNTTGGVTLPGLIKTGATKVGSAVAGGTKALAGLAASNPIAAIGIGAGVGGALLAKHFIGQGRRAADKLTGEGGLQNSFEKTLNEIDLMNVPDDQKNQYKNQAYQELIKQGMEYAKKGSNESKVISQMFDTISPLFGATNPLKTAQS